MDKKWLFDRPWTQEFTKVRQRFIGEFLGAVRKKVELASALDVGCGIGYFAEFLASLHFRVVAVDGREENVREGQKRYPKIVFLTKNVETLEASDLGTFDYVQCVGILYHLENPFRAIRRLHSLTDKILLIETMCVPASEPTLELLDEGIGEDQSLNYVAFYPSESCLIKMLYKAGFPYVYRFERLPADELFTGSLWRKQQRTFLVASKIALAAHNLALTKQPVRYAYGKANPWTTRPSRLRDSAKAGLFRVRVLASRLLRSLRKSVDAKSSDDLTVEEK